MRRREIAEAALQVIGKQGAPALTAARIAAEVGVTAGALFRHFASLEAILDAAVDYAVEALEETFPDRALPPLERLRSLTSARVRLIVGRPGLGWLLQSDQVYLTVSKRSVARLRSIVKRSRAFLLAALREAAAEGTIRDDLPSESLLPVLTGTVHAAIGSMGVHRARKAASDPLDALFQLLSPTD